MEKNMKKNYTHTHTHTHTHTYLNHFAIHQKLTKHCNSTILQFKKESLQVRRNNTRTARQRLGRSFGDTTTPEA